MIKIQILFCWSVSVFVFVWGRKAEVLVLVDLQTPVSHKRRLPSGIRPLQTLLLFYGLHFSKTLFYPESSQVGMVELRQLLWGCLGAPVKVLSWFYVMFHCDGWGGGGGGGKAARTADEGGGGKKEGGERREVGERQRPNGSLWFLSSGLKEIRIFYSEGRPGGWGELEQLSCF